MKRLCIDINSVLPLASRGYLTGVGRTTYELLLEFEKMKAEIPFEIVLFSQNTKGITSETLGFSFESKHLNLPYRPQLNKYLSYVNFRERFVNADMWHIPHNSDYVGKLPKTIFTLHDMLMYTCLDEFPEKAYAEAFRTVPKNMRESKAIITCSHSTKNDIVKYMDIDPAKIHVIHWGINHNLFRIFPDKGILKEEISRTFRINNPYFFSVSCGKGRKNTVNLLLAYQELLRSNPENDLVIIWDHFGDDIQNILDSSGGRIHALSGISNEILVKLYNGASLVYYPSKYEGFGLPVLESMACGTPVVTGRNSSLTEVGGEFAIYLESEDIRSIYQTMVCFENGGYDISSIKEGGFRWSEQFRWNNCAKETIKVYQQYLY